MSPKSLGRVLAKVAAPFNARKSEPVVNDLNYVELVKRIEQRAYLVSMEARAQFADIARLIEKRALLASQESKAYADGALQSLAMGLRAMSKVTLRLQQRVDAIEAMHSDVETLCRRLTEVEQRIDVTLRLEQRVGAIEAMHSDVEKLCRRLTEVEQRIDVTLRLEQRVGAIEAMHSDVEKLCRRLTEVEQRIDAFRDQALETRVEMCGAMLRTLTNRVNESERLDRKRQREIDRINGDRRDLSAEMVDMVAAFREFEGRFEEMYQHSPAERPTRKPGPRAPSSLDAPLNVRQNELRPAVQDQRIRRSRKHDG